MYLSNAKDQVVTDSVNLLNAKYVSVMNPTCMQIPNIVYNLYMSAQTFIHMQHPSDSITSSIHVQVLALMHMQHENVPERI